MRTYSARHSAFPAQDALLSLVLYTALFLFASATSWHFALSSLAALALLFIARTIVARIRELRAIERIGFSRVWDLPGEQAQEDKPQGFGEVGHGC